MSLFDFIHYLFEKYPHLIDRHPILVLIMAVISDMFAFGIALIPLLIVVVQKRYRCSSIEDDKHDEDFKED